MLWSCNYYSRNYYYNLLQLFIYAIIILFSSLTLYIFLFQNLQYVNINDFNFTIHYRQSYMSIKTYPLKLYVTLCSVNGTFVTIEPQTLV